MNIVKDAIICEAKGPEDMLQQTVEYEKERHQRATPLNPESSRGHMIFSLIVERTEKNRKSGKAATIAGKLSLIDLAGSEDPRKTGTDSGDAAWRWVRCGAVQC
jgi:hypothetical protein